MRINPNSPLPFLLADRKTVAICDPEDFYRVSHYHWRLQKNNGRPVAAFKLDCGRRITLHRFILPVEGNIRFRDGNPLNCSKQNLVTVKGGNHA